MKRLKNNKRVQKIKKEHVCKFEYNVELSKPNQSVFTCVTQKCENDMVENEDAPAGC